ncbi:hypothetical protein CWR48_13235 [Oceanobacillus arenosus]|uniref:Uncharacterized protein n=1 Tax=Oceanobacillus arenosus TaxID=1229153 RepID=A0A3D8PN06_9BACI|nr:hypothetical protein [Oceanobacillus arenosus]RDW17483.1 hypothetical protein CWR48_13235 [Oceanobacillus arenosus]
MIKTGKRGEVWTVELNGKRRPVVIVSNNNVVVELDHLIATERDETGLITPVSFLCHISTSI